MCKDLDEADFHARLACRGEGWEWLPCSANPGAGSRGCFKTVLFFFLQTLFGFLNLWDVL